MNLLTRVFSMNLAKNVAPNSGTLLPESVVATIRPELGNLTASMGMDPPLCS